MVTLLVLSTPTLAGEPGTCQGIVVEESYDQVLNKIIPVHPPTNPLEAQDKVTYHDENGNRIMIQPAVIVSAQENYVEE